MSTLPCCGSTVTYIYARLAADLYIVIYDAIVKNGADNVDHGEKGYYFVENGEHSWYELSKAIGSAMVELGFSKSDEPTTFTTEELIKYFSSEVSSVLSYIHQYLRYSHVRR